MLQHTKLDDARGKPAGISRGWCINPKKPPSVSVRPETIDFRYMFTVAGCPRNFPAKSLQPHPKNFNIFAPDKNDAWKTTFLLGWYHPRNYIPSGIRPIFRGYGSFMEGIPLIFDIPMIYCPFRCFYPTFIHLSSLRKQTEYDRQSGLTFPGESMDFYPRGTLLVMSVGTLEDSKCKGYSWQGRFGSPKKLFKGQLGVP